MFRVLVVDDDGTLRMTVAASLGEANYQVDQAVDGEEAVNKVHATDYNLVILDVNMPKMNGIEALKQIKAYDPSIIILMLTAYSNVKDAVQAIKDGAYNYLEKPIKSDNLVAIFHQILKQTYIFGIALSKMIIAVLVVTFFNLSVFAVIVYSYNFMPSAKQIFHKITADETCRTCYKYLHSYIMLPLSSIFQTS